MTNAPVAPKEPFRNLFPIALIVVCLVALIAILWKVDWSFMKFSSSPKAAPASLQQHPICLGALNRSITFKPGEKKKVVMPDERCFGEWVDTPVGAAIRIDRDTTVGSWARVVYWDGSGPYEVRPGQPLWLGIRCGIFRIMGRGPVTVSVSEANGSKVSILKVCK